MANSFTGGSNVSVSRPLDRIFDDAQHTGEVILCGRKLREYPKIAGKYDLVDTVSIGKCQSKNTGYIVSHMELGQIESYFSLQVLEKIIVLFLYQLFKQKM